jgi:serine protease inhibitor
VSGAAIWPLVAALAAGAVGAARTELERTIGIPADDALSEAARIIAMLEVRKETHAALGIWLRDAVVLDPTWSSGLPADSIGRLTGVAEEDRVALDGWVRERTLGMIDRMPTAPSPDARLVLAAALAVRTAWAAPFHDWDLTPESGPWAGRTFGALRCRWPDLDLVAIAETAVGSLSLVTVAGSGEVDVHLVAAPEEAIPGAALAEAVATFGGERPMRRGSAFSDGDVAPGIAVVTSRDTQPDPYVDVTTVRFDLLDKHDLAALPDVFGIRAALDARRGHFPGIGAEPLAVGQTEQVASATFSADGFEAAAASASVIVLGAPEPEYSTRRIVVTFDRPFGFLAIDRTTGLVLFAGWIADPAPWDARAEERFRKLLQTRSRYGPAAGDR